MVGVFGITAKELVVRAKMVFLRPTAVVATVNNFELNSPMHITSTS